MHLCAIIQTQWTDNTDHILGAINGAYFNPFHYSEHLSVEKKKCILPERKRNKTQGGAARKFKGFSILAHNR